MSSLQSHIVQIPRNSHFRPLPSLANTQGVMLSSFLTFNANSGVAPRLTNPNNVGATGTFGGHPSVTSEPAASALSSGTGILKDLGETIVSSGRTFRRVQLIVPSGVSPTTDDFNEMMGGTYTGADSDALAGYIELGLRGIGVVGPYVRAL